MLHIRPLITPPPPFLNRLTADPLGVIQASVGSIPPEDRPRTKQVEEARAAAPAINS